MNCPSCQNFLRDTVRFCTACGTEITKVAPTATGHSQSFRTHYDPESEATVVRPGRMIGRLLDGKYQILARLGEGGMGTVYRARRLHIGDEVAVKILHSRFVSEEDGIERFRREARAAALLHHPNVVIIHDYGESGGDAAPAFIVMELISGLSLRDLLKREGRLSIGYAVALMSHICAGVAAAHRQNIIHRDLKPDNILLPSAAEEEGQVTAKVVDFGIAKLRDLTPTQSLTMTGGMIGTPNYMSPEQCRGETLDARSDVYSLGSMMYEMLAGVRPFTSHTPTAVVAKHLTEAPPPFAAQLGIPLALEAVIMRALAKDASARQSDAAVLARQLRDAWQPAAQVAGIYPPTPAARIEVPIQPPRNFQQQQQQPFAKTYQRLPEASPKISPGVWIAIFLLIFGASGVAAILLMRTNQSASGQRATLNQNATLDSKTTSDANANSSPPDISIVKERPPEKPDKNQPPKELVVENKPDKNQPPVASTVDVTGNWQSFYGSIRLTQSGTAISGSIRYADGSGVGRISGTINGRKLTFRWQDDTSSYNGAGTVQLSADGHSLRGSIRLNGTTQPLELQR